MKGFFRTAVILSLAFLSIQFSATAQDTIVRSKKQKHTNAFWHRVSVGGNLGFQFGSVAGIMLMPEAKIRIVDQLYGGLGFNYEYNRFKNYYYDTKNQEYLNYSINMYGGRIFFRYYLASIFHNFLSNVFAHVEYEYLTYTKNFVYDPKGVIVDPYYNTLSPGKQVVEVSSLFVGGGYKQPLGIHTFLDFVVLFNLNDTYNSPYSNPVLRIGFGYNF